MGAADTPLLIGSSEWCALPQLGLPLIRARADSGARTSSLHAWRIRHFRRGGEDWVSFSVHPLQGDRRTAVRCEAVLTDLRRVRSSSGKGEQRYVIRTALQLDATVRDIELTLGSRDSMGFRMLLGREAMTGIVVAPDRQELLGEPAAAAVMAAYRDNAGCDQALTIGVLTASRKDPLLPRLEAEAGRRGHTIRIVEIAARSIGPLPETVGEDSLWDALIPLAGRHCVIDSSLVLRARQYDGVFVGNDADGLLAARDRRLLLQRLAQQGVPVVPSQWRSRTSGTGLPATAAALVREGAGACRLVAREQLDDGAVDDSVPCLVQDPGTLNPVLLRAVGVGARVRACPLRPGRGGRLVEEAAGVVSLTVAQRTLLRGAVRALGLRYALVDFVSDTRGMRVIDVDPFTLGRSRSPGTARARVRLVEGAMGIAPGR